MEQTTAKKWYDNNVLVAVLCFLFFPVGLYALWKSTSRSQGWKIGGTIAVAVLIIVAINSDDKRPKRSEDASAAMPTDTLQHEASVQPEATDVEPIKTDQEAFLDTKIKAFTDYVLGEPIIQKRSETIDTFKSSSLKATRIFLAERESRLVEWSARVISVDMDKAEECDISLSILPARIVGSKQVGPRTMDCGITIEAIQATVKALGSKGIKRSGPLYGSVKALNPGDEVVFTAKVNKVEENSEATGLNYSTVLYIELEDIKKQ